MREGLRHRQDSGGVRAETRAAECSSSESCGVVSRAGGQRTAGAHLQEREASVGLLQDVAAVVGGVGVAVRGTLSDVPLRQLETLLQRFHGHVRKHIALFIRLLLSFFFFLSQQLPQHSRRPDSPH